MYVGLLAFIAFAFPLALILVAALLIYAGYRRRVAGRRDDK